MPRTATSTKRTGRPSTFNPDTAEAILSDIAAGEPGYKAAAANGVSHGTFWGWLAANPDLADKYARAKLAGLERLADEIMQIADECRRGVKTTTKPDGSTETVEGDMVDRARLQIDSRKWLLSKLLPKTYGDRLEHVGTVNVSISTILAAANGRLIEHEQTPALPCPDSTQESDSP
jgi:hypothetical protein